MIETDECERYGVEKIIVARENEKVYPLCPQQMAGDFFRLISVLTLALGIITNTKEESIDLEVMDKNDFYVLMYGECIEDAIKAFSFDSMSILQKLSKISSYGLTINWEKVWSSYPFNRINISQVLKENKNRMCIINELYSED